MMCFENMESGHPANDFEIAEIFVRMDKLERFIDGKNWSRFFIIVIHFILIIYYFITYWDVLFNNKG